MSTPAPDLDLHLAQEPEADALLSTDPFALLTGMLLDQQFPMERAFAGPALLARRLGTPGRLDPVLVAGWDPEDFRRLCAGPPAVHRYHGSMAARLQDLAAFVVEHHDGDASRVWTEARTGEALLRRLVELPGFGDRKAQIMLSLLGKQLGVRPRGWRTAGGDFARAGTFLSVADVVDRDSLARVRATKKALKASAAS